MDILNFKESDNHRSIGNVGWSAILFFFSFIVIFHGARSGIRSEFFFDEAWRADLIRAAEPLGRYRMHNTPIPPLWVGLLRCTDLVLPRGFMSLRLQGLALSMLFPLSGGLLAATIVGFRDRNRAILTSVLVGFLFSTVLVGTGIASYLNDYAFQAAVVVVLVNLCVLADCGAISRSWVAAGLLVTPFATIGGLVVLPAICLWWIIGNGIPKTSRNFLKACAVPAVSALLVIMLYTWLYRPQIDSSLENFWAAELIYNGSRTPGEVLTDIPRSLARGLFALPDLSSRSGVWYGGLIIVLAIAGLWWLRRGWRWLPLIVLTSWPVAAVLSLVGAWPVTFVRVNLPFVWLWYFSALIALVACIEWLLRRPLFLAHALCFAVCFSFLPGRVRTDNAPFARGLYNDLNLIRSSPYDRNIVLSYHFMSHWYVHDALLNASDRGFLEMPVRRFTILREKNGSRELMEGADQSLLNAGWSKGTAVWCVIPYEVGPEATDLACRIGLSGLKQKVFVRGKRAIIAGWYPES